MYKFATTLMRHLSDFQLGLAIARKWKLDCRHLPLSASHWELYQIIHRLCIREIGGFPNLIECPDFNSKIQWLKLFDQHEAIVACSDKLLVRDFVLDRVGAKYLLNIYQVGNHFSEIDFEKLPDSFVIKTNHDSGTVVLVRDKSTMGYEEIKARIENSLDSVYGWEKGEWAYSCIGPKVFVEELIDHDHITPPPDYKFHCANGRVRWLQYIFDRGHGTKEVIVSIDGTPTGYHFDTNMIHCSYFDVPPNFQEMKAVAEKLARDFRYVRVDMFRADGRIYVGELTFFPLMGCYRGDGQRELGKLLDFDRTTSRTPIVTGKANVQ